jgi:hypothetical protein
LVEPPKTWESSGVRPSASLGLLALCVGLGTLGSAELFVFPALDAHVLLDANLAKSIAAPLHTRLAEVELAAGLVLAAVAHQWLGSRWAQSLAIVVCALATLQRVVILPALYDAWARTDLVAGRPVERLLDAQHLASRQQLVATAMAMLLVAIVVLASRPTKAALPVPLRTVDASPEPTPVEPTTQAA